MNGSSSPSQELPLPMPSPESGVNSAEAPAGIEIKTGGSVMPQGPSTPMQMVDPSQFATGVPITTAAPTDDRIATASADDEDVIEKEWVSKAKAIVDNTKDNPNAQSKELGKFKAEYIKKRFNKDMKTAKETVEEPSSR